jgi:hypothetical protein
MAKFSKTQPAVQAAIQTVSTDPAAPDTLTREGGAGWTRDAKSELFLLAIHNFVGEQTFYEHGRLRDQRFGDLVHTVAAEDPDWVARFVPYLRSTLHMRSASVVMAVEAARAMPAGPGSREQRAALVDAACERADEPAEALGYYMATNPRPRVLPNWLRMGLARAAVRLYDEFAVLQHDGQDRAIRMADVLELCHTPAQSGWKADLFRHILDRRHGHDAEIPASLQMLRRNRELRGMPAERRREWLASTPSVSAVLRQAGMKWSDLDGWLQGPMNATAWQTVIPSMGYMALLRNLRNFDQAGVPDEVAERIAGRLADPEQVARSKQLPIRFYTAFKATGSLRWAWALERAVNASLANVPRLGGRTLVLVDCSNSMTPSWSGTDRNGLSRAEYAGLFAAALALRAEQPTLAAYGFEAELVDVPKGGSVLPLARQFNRSLGGTRTFDVLARLYAGHDRVVILTDEQAFAPGSDARRQYGGDRHGLHSAQGLDEVIGHIRCPIYTWNLAGYKTAQLPSGGNRFTFGGLTDNAFSAIEQLEAKQAVGWPF